MSETLKQKKIREAEIFWNLEMYSIIWILYDNDSFKREIFSWK